MKVLKRNGQLMDFDLNKIETAVRKAFESQGVEYDDTIVTEVKMWLDCAMLENPISVEKIQDMVERSLMQSGHCDVAKAFILYRQQHQEARFIRERIDYMDRYSNSSDNAATSSETDGNANVTMKNVANLEGEVYKTTNRLIQRQRMKNELQKLYPKVAEQYEKDLNHHIIYTHDEASVPTTKFYCQAVSLYPLMTEGVGNIDGVTPSEPNDLQSFSGQITNLAFLLSSQCKGAVAFGEYFIALNYYAVMEFGPLWYEKLDCIVSTSHCKIQRTVKDSILKAFKQFVWGVNQPAGNRSYQSPFTNISYYDQTYFHSLFKNFCYPDASKPEWEAIDTLQRLFMKWFNQIRLKQVLTFPVETFAMVHDGKDIVDQDYKQLCAEMYAEGHSFFTYISDSADSLASCCRLRNEVSENTFSPTSGLTGVMTGSCNVITLNINRIIQDCVKAYGLHGGWVENTSFIKDYLVEILKRVYKYHIAFKTMLYDLEEQGMFAASNGGYIYMSKLYSTIGINGLNEAARFLGMQVSNNPEYIRFLQLILGTIKEQNKLYSVHDRKRPFLFNSEVVPAEGLGGKNYNWDKEDGYWVPEDENLYNSYFYNAHDDTSVLDKFILHGRQTYQYTDGGSAAHINLEDHLSKEQYLKLIDFAIENGTSYFTFNVPNSKCEDCGHIIKKPIIVCPKCGGLHITQYTRVIGYLRPIKTFGQDRQVEAAKRVYSNGKEQIQ
ncbi:anaerobic ribonucleoside-triphosphate reductase [Phocaeicola dorei]|jgi:ribonucleoside-triphosphate reductase|uniref:anaerobic ribonucleoside-triphosphate reductase n=1 Tax=Phocaeicola dorei TaxID=357276 RepID=UPI001BDDD3DC|nr:anaerobic ribonucleoside-triphosphate reductase [Phocaeicola dorei]MBT1285824.1 anaerobic ribonucleoside-triphosphate reductase [Phocaeicola dorei]MBT1289692.1 anaerobic ribonucleoside-triphosphate reductase [Phocaeicola dorei]